MIGLEDRRQMAQMIEVAHSSGARLSQACKLVGMDVRMLQRWKARDGLLKSDRRPDAPRPRPTPAHAQTAAERAAVLQVANEPRFTDMPPARIVPMLTDEGTYLASESSFWRIILRAAGQSRYCGRARPPQARRAPQTHVARGSSQVWAGT